MQQERERTTVSLPTMLGWLLLGLQRHWRAALASTLCGGCFGLLAGVLKPNLYESAGKLLVRPGVRDAISAESILTGASAGMQASRNVVHEQVQVLSSLQLYEAVVADLGAAKVLQAYDPTSLDSEQTNPLTRAMHELQAWWFRSTSEGVEEIGATLDQFAARRLAQMVIITPDPQSGVITISYSTHSPELARDVVDAVLRVAPEIYRSVFDATQTLVKVEGPARESETAARTAEEAFAKFCKEHSIYSIDVQRTAMLAQQGALDTELGECTAEIARLTAERAALGEMQPQTESGMEVLNPEYTALQSQIRDIEQRLVDLDVARLDLNSNPGRIEQQTAILKRWLETVKERAKGHKVTIELPSQDSTSRAQRIQQELDRTDVALKGLAQRREELLARAGDLRTRQGQLEADAVAMRHLELDAQQKRRDADRLGEAVNELKRLQTLDQLNLSSMNVLHPAVLPFDKIGPRRQLYLFAGLLLGIGVGLVYCVLRMQISRHVVRAVELERRSMPVRYVFGRRPQATGALLPQQLQAALGDMRADLAVAWSTMPQEAQAERGLVVAFVGDGDSAAAMTISGCIAAGLALHGGERVAYVDCRNESPWLASRLDLPSSRGWADVVVGRAQLAEALRKTQVPNLNWLPMGDVGDMVPHPMCSREFANVLRQLSAQHDFVVVDLPDLDEQPEGRAVLRAVDVSIAACGGGRSRFQGVREMITATVDAGARFYGVYLVETPAATGRRHS